MKVLILGSGVIGVTTAYFLHKSGHEVIVLDRHTGPAQECSYANGGQLSYNHAEPWASPDALMKALSWLGRNDVPLVYRFSLKPEFLIWNMMYLTNCTPGKVKKNTETLLRLGLYSRKKMHEIVEDIDFDFSYSQDGKLMIFESEKEFDAARKQMDFQRTLGGVYEEISAEQCIEKEPALIHLKDRLIGGIYDHDDESGDIYMFTKRMAEYLEKRGVQFLYGTTVNSIKTKGNEIAAIETDKGPIICDAYVMSLGARSGQMLRKIGVNVPMYPLKGYSISIDCSNAEYAPKLSVTQTSRKLVYSRLGDVVRVAGFAEFAGFNDSIDPLRIEMLKKDTKAIFPDCGDIDNAREWACLRPATPDWPPVLGKTKYSNFFLNTGQGSLGWTQAAGSARIVSDIINERQPEISLERLTTERFGW